MTVPSTEGRKRERMEAEKKDPIAEYQNRHRPRAMSGFGSKENQKSKCKREARNA
jgi:hypothetical protein